MFKHCRKRTGFCGLRKTRLLSRALSELSCILSAKRLSVREKEARKIIRRGTVSLSNALQGLLRYYTYSHNGSPYFLGGPICLNSSWNYREKARTEVRPTYFSTMAGRTVTPSSANVRSTIVFCDSMQRRRNIYSFDQKQNSKSNSKW